MAAPVLTSGEFARLRECDAADLGKSKAVIDVQYTANGKSRDQANAGLMWFTDKNGRKQRTTIWKYAQARQWPQMCNRLTDFVNADGKRSPGLVNRRNDFKAWCLLGLSTPP